MSPTSLSCSLLWVATVMILVGSILPWRHPGQMNNSFPASFCSSEVSSNLCSQVSQLRGRQFEFWWWVRSSSVSILLWRLQWLPRSLTNLAQEVRMCFFSSDVRVRVWHHLHEVSLWTSRWCFSISVSPTKCKPQSSQNPAVWSSSIDSPSSRGSSSSNTSISSSESVSWPAVDSSSSSSPSSISKHSIVFLPRVFFVLEAEDNDVGCGGLLTGLGVMATLLVFPPKPVDFLTLLSLFFVSSVKSETAGGSSMSTTSISS